jgi:hypothetical protein
MASSGIEQVPTVNSFAEFQIYLASTSCVAQILYILATVNDLPALLLAGGMFGDFLGALLIFASIISMLEIKFSFQGSPQKRSKK